MCNNLRTIWHCVCACVRACVCVLREASQGSIYDPRERRRREGARERSTQRQGGVPELLLRQRQRQRQRQQQRQLQVQSRFLIAPLLRADRDELLRRRKKKKLFSNLQVGFSTSSAPTRRLSSLSAPPLPALLARDTTRAAKTNKCHKS